MKYTTDKIANKRTKYRRIFVHNPNSKESEVLKILVRSGRREYVDIALQYGTEDVLALAQSMDRQLLALEREEERLEKISETNRNLVGSSDPLFVGPVLPDEESELQFGESLEDTLDEVLEGKHLMQNSIDKVNEIEISDKDILNDKIRTEDLWKNEVWSPYHDWMRNNPGTGNKEREKYLINIIECNPQMFIDAANQKKVQGKISPPLIAAILWDEIVGSGYDGSSGYDSWDGRDDKNTFLFVEGETYGPFQIGIRTAIDIIENGYGPKPKNYDSYFSNEKDAYLDRKNNKIKNNNGQFLSKLGKEKLEFELTKFSYSINLAAGRLAQIVDYWNKKGGADLRYADGVIGTLYSWRLQGNGVHGNPKPNERGSHIAKKSLEFNKKIFHNTYIQNTPTSIK